MKCITIRDYRKWPISQREHTVLVLESWFFIPSEMSYGHRIWDVRAGIIWAVLCTSVLPAHLNGLFARPEKVLSFGPDLQMGTSDKGRMPHPYK